MFKIFDIPQIFNVIPITNIDISFDYESGCANLSVFSKEKILALSNGYFSLRDPYFSIKFDKNKEMTLVLSVDLYFKEKKLVKIDKSIIDLLKKGLEVK